MSARKLTVPYAVAESDRLTPIAPSRELSREQRYLCPECGGRLILRAGDKVVAHFAHYEASPSCAFGSESWQHVLAKHLIVLSVYNWRAADGPCPRLVRRCPAGHEIRQLLPESVARAEVERTVSRKTGIFRLDVALLDSSGDPCAGIEVLHTHKVNVEKELLFLGLAVMEVEACKVIEDPENLDLVREWHLRPLSCGECERLREARRREAEQEAAQRAEAARRNAERHKRSEAFRLAKERRKRVLPVTWRERSDGRKLPHVEPCAAKANFFHDRTYANVRVDCEECPHLINIRRPPNKRYPRAVECGYVPEREARSILGPYLHEFWAPNNRDW